MILKYTVILFMKGNAKYLVKKLIFHICPSSNEKKTFRRMNVPVFIEIGFEEQSEELRSYFKSLVRFLFKVLWLGT